MVSAAAQAVGKDLCILSILGKYEENTAKMSADLFWHKFCF